MAHLGRTLIVIALIAAAGLVVALALAKRGLERQLLDLSARARDPYPGFYVPPMRLATLSGDSVTLGGSPSGPPQVLFVFNTTCPFCRASLPTWGGAAARLRDHGVETYGVSLDGPELTQAYVEQHGLAYPVVCLTDSKHRALYRASVVPQTLVLDADGQVRYARLGAVTGPSVEDSIVTAVTALRAERATPGSDSGG